MLATQITRLRDAVAEGRDHFDSFDTDYAALCQLMGDDAAYDAVYGDA